MMMVVDWVILLLSHWTTVFADLILVISGRFLLSDHKLALTATEEDALSLMTDFIIILAVNFTQLMLKGEDLRLQTFNVLLLVPTLLSIGWCTNVVLEGDRVPGCLQVTLGEGKITLPLQKINAIETIVAPAFTHFKVWWELTDHTQARRLTMVKHLYTILVLARLTQSLKHLKKDADVVTLGYSVTIGVYFKSPSKAIEDEWVRIDHFMGVADSWEVLDHESGAFIVRYQLRGEIHTQWMREGRLRGSCRFVMDLSQLADKLSALRDESALWLGGKIPV